MKIIADENINLLHDFFADIGELITLPGREITNEHLQQADALLVRSVTQVNESLVANTPVKFVGTATSGIDHIDTDYLSQHSMTFANAPGCNAHGIVDYVCSVLAVLNLDNQFALTNKTVGIIGLGEVGQRLYDRLTQLGVTCLQYDPPLAEQDKDDFVDLEQVLACDILTIHVPLIKSGDYPTYHLFNQAIFSQLKLGAVLINTARGAVIDNTELLTVLNDRDDLTVILDVWENEPGINIELLQKVMIGTPHIAGYSLEGKCRGTEMIYQALCRCFGLPARKQMSDFLPSGTNIQLDATDKLQQALAEILFHYDVREDDNNMRQLLSLSLEEQKKYFDQLRKNYPVRREINLIC